MTDTIARTIAALREFPVAVAAELYRLAPGRKPPNGDDILVLCDAAEASLRATNEIERAYQILEVNGVPRGRARNIANGIDVLVTRMERGLRYPPREPTRAMLDAGSLVFHREQQKMIPKWEPSIAARFWRAMWDAAPKINGGGQDVDKSVHADGSSPSVPVPPSPDAMSHTWKSGYAQAKEEDVLSRRFCPHCNPCDGAGNEECRKPVPPSPDADLVARATAYLTGGGLFNPELANHDAVRNLIIDCRDAIERLTREINLSRQYAAGKDADYVTELGARLAAERERDEARDLCAKLRNEARVHAQEARTANATIAKIYRACTGGTGEPGNWRGAQPVIDTLARLTRELDEALDAQEWAEKGNGEYQHLLRQAEKNLAQANLERDGYASRAERAETECERLRAALLHLEQAYSNRHSPQHRAAALNSAQGLLAAIDAARQGE